MSTTSRLDVVEVGGTTIESIVSSTTNGNVTMLKSHGSADVAPLFIGAGTENNEIRFSTNDLKSLLITEDVGVLGKVLDSASNQYWKLVPEAGRNARTDTTHTRCTINQGVVYWDTITLRNNDFATVDVVMVASYDGTNRPIVATGSVALPTSELSPAVFYGVGPIQINGTLVEKIQEVTISSGMTAEPKFADNIPWPWRINLRMVEPTVTIVTETIAHLPSIGLSGGALNGTTGLALYGRKFVNNTASGAQRVADATEEHLKITIPSGTYRVDTTSASGNDAAQTTIMCDVAVADSGDSPMTFTEAAIPTS